MGSDPVAPLAALACLFAGGCLLIASRVYPRGWQVGMGLGAAGSALLAGALVARGLRAGHWPLTSEYEFALAFALATGLATVGLPMRQRDRARTAEGLAMLLAAGLVAYARLVLPAFKRAIRPLPPALDSGWLPLHVATAALAYGTLAVAGAAGLVWLTREPEQGAAARLLRRSIAGGYPLLTVSMIFGMIWAQVAWGRYWGWDLKEVWTLSTWLIYTLYWHLYRHPGWQGRRVAWLALIGLGAVLFTFLGTGWLARAVGLESLHLF